MLLNKETKPSQTLPSRLGPSNKLTASLQNGKILQEQVSELFEIKLLIMNIKMDLPLNNLYWLICHKTKPNQRKQNRFSSKYQILEHYMF